MTDEIAISHLQKRKIEARALLPFIAVCRDKFGDAATREVIADAITATAAKEGAQWAERFGGDVAGLRKLAETVWGNGGGLDLEVVDETADRLAFNVTRCRYAEFYKELGLQDLGVLIHCNRDRAMVAGFAGDVELERSQTIMQGGGCCDFRFRRKA
jgi:hypothetical protein